jgi:hypothetical protein
MLTMKLLTMPNVHIKRVMTVGVSLLTRRIGILLETTVKNATMGPFPPQGLVSVHHAVMGCIYLLVVRLVLKTIVLVPTALKQRAQHVLPMMLIFVRPVPVNITRLVKPAPNAPVRVALVKEKRLRALRHRIVFVLKTFVLVPTALKQRAQHVLPMVLIFVRPVTLDITKLTTTPLRHRIVFVLKTIVLVPMALQQRAQHVLPMMLIFVCPVALNIT